MGENKQTENEKPSVTLETGSVKKASKPKKKEQASLLERIATWFKEVKAEAFKIIWPNRTELVKMTFTVIVTSLLFGALIAGLDTVFGFAVGFLVSVF